ncbi:MAG: hypothetical protein FD140_4514 [Limisphaerales bacterium]|nr:MAG: hypothetical protein FD140_4514 [Limisphaerales bacterium]
MKLKSRIAAPIIATGQVWRLNGDINCHIGEVGKRLVHYKMFKGKPVRIPSTLGNLAVLTKHLKAKKAVLVQG